MRTCRAASISRRWSRCSTRTCAIRWKAASHRRSEVKRDLVPGLRAHPACYVFLAYRDDTPVGFSICFLGFSTFNARPLINIHDIFVDSSVRGLGIGAMLLERIEAKARELNCCRITLEVRKDNRVARGLYRKVGFDQVVVGADRIPMEFWHKPL